MEDNLVHTAREGDRASVAASIFSRYAYNELSEQLEIIGWLAENGAHDPKACHLE